MLITDTSKVQTIVSFLLKVVHPKLKKVCHDFSILMSSKSYDSLNIFKSNIAFFSMRKVFFHKLE